MLKKILNTFLLLTLCFLKTNVFASVTHKYYIDTSRANSCSLSFDDMCAGVATRYGNAGSYRCDNYSLFYQYLRGVNNQYGSATDLINADTPHRIGERSITCKDNETVNLDESCTATCVADPCKQYEGQTFRRQVTCGTASCVTPAKFAGDASSVGCTSGPSILRKSIAQSATNNLNSCSGVLANPPNDNAYKVKRANAIGQSSTTAYCDADFIYTGTGGNNQDDENGLVSFDFAGVTPTTEDGQCPPNTVKGQFGANGEWICYPDTPTENQCPTGQIRDNTGTCVNPEDAGQCEDGQVRNSSGACVTPNPDGNPDSGGDDDDDDDNGGGGECTGIGCPNHNNGESDTDGDGIPDSEDNMTDSDGDGNPDKGDFYEDNCNKIPPCNTDPVQCAILRNQIKANCEANRPLDDEEKAMTTKAIDEVDKQTRDAISDFQTKVNSVINENSLFTQSANTNTTCIPDKQVKIIGNASITVKYSLLCPYFNLLRNMLILVSYMFAARIVYAEVTGGGIRV